MDSNNIPSNRMLQLLHSSSPCINHSWGQLNHVKIQICLHKTIICTFLQNSLLHFTTMRSFTLAGSQYCRPLWTLFLFEGANQAWKLFTTLLAIIRFLNFEFNTPPNPSQSLNPLLVKAFATLDDGCGYNEDDVHVAKAVNDLLPNVRKDFPLIFTSVMTNDD